MLGMQRAKHFSPKTSKTSDISNSVDRLSVEWSIWNVSLECAFCAVGFRR